MAIHENMTIKVDLRRVPRKVQQMLDNPKVLKELGETWAEKFVNFMPQGATGKLVNDMYVTSDGYVIYNAPYAHYMWEGDEYIWAFYTDPATGETTKLHFAPAGMRKMPSGDKLTEYVQYEPHWEQKAYEVYRDEVAEHMTAFIKGL